MEDQHQFQYKFCDIENANINDILCVIWKYIFLQKRLWKLNAVFKLLNDAFSSLVCTTMWQRYVRAHLIRTSRLLSRVSALWVRLTGLAGPLDGSAAALLVGTLDTAAHEHTCTLMTHSTSRQMLRNKCIRTGIHLSLSTHGLCKPGDISTAIHTPDEQTRPPSDLKPAVRS